MFINGYPYTDFHELNADFLVKNYKLLLDSLKQIDGWIENHEKEYDELKKLYDDIVAGNFPPAMYQSLYNWVVKNSKDIIGDLVKMVFFELTDDGYFVAHIPDSWSDIRFGTTGLDIIIPGYDYGHLVLSY